MVTIAGIEADLVSAQADFEEATQRLDAAALDQTDALNRMNRAQRALDHALGILRAAAPAESDWKKKHG
jgi:hypothetical protein